jgi:hypothetical protein
LVFTVIMLAAVKQKATFLAPIGIGIALFIGHMLSETCSAICIPWTWWRPSANQIFARYLLYRCWN